MVATRTKISWSLAIILAGSAAALLFRQPPPQAPPPATPQAASPTPRAAAIQQTAQYPSGAPASPTRHPARQQPATHANAARPSRPQGQKQPPSRQPPRGQLLGRIDLFPDPAASTAAPSAPLDDALPDASHREPPAQVDAGRRQTTAEADTCHTVKHRVRDGDTLSFLALRYLGAARRYLEIYEANRNILPSPDLLPLGVVLEIPLAPESVFAAGSLAAEEAPLVPIPPGARGRHSRSVSLQLGGSAEAPARTYRMRAGETLVDVARRVLGDASLADLLYQANRDRLRHPQDVQEGVLLVLPASEQQRGL
jgi:nucleoid-associated protein YgaU